MCDFEQEEEEIEELCSLTQNTIEIIVANQPIMEVRFKISDNTKYDIGTKEDWAQYIGEVIQSKAEEMILKNRLH